MLTHGPFGGMSHSPSVITTDGGTSRASIDRVLGMSKSTGSRFGRILFWLTVLVGLPTRRALGLYWLTTLPDVAALAKHRPTDTALMEARRAQAERTGPQSAPAIHLGPADANCARTPAGGGRG